MIEKIDEIYYNETKYYYNKDLELIRIIYKSDNEKVEGFIIKKRLQDRKLPVLIYCRGGDNIKINKLGKKLDDKPSRFLDDELFHNLIDNFIIFSSNYRGSNYSTGVDEFGGNDVNDVVNLLPIINKYKLANNNKINFWGYSRGSMMVFLAYKKIKIENLIDVKKIKSIIITGGFFDTQNASKFKTEYKQFLIKSLKLNDNDIKNREAINFVKYYDTPILLIHGKKDKQISYHSSVNFSNILKKENKIHKLITFENMTHDIRNVKKVNKEILKWLKIHNNIMVLDLRLLIILISLLFFFNIFKITIKS